MYLFLGFVILVDACTTTNVLISKSSISIDINIGIISCNDFITGRPYIEPRSRNITVMPFNNITLTCVVPQVLDLPLIYTWYRDDGTKSIGVHSSKFTIPRFGLADEGQYYCEAKAFGHCGKSNRVTLILDGEKILLS